MQACLRVRRHGRGHEEETVDGAAAAEQLADEAGHGDLPVLLADERGHDAETHHEVARVAAEDHVAARVEREGIEHKVVGARHRPLESECFLLQKARGE